MRSKSNDRLTSAVLAEITNAKAKRTAAKGTLPAMDTFLALNNASGPQQTGQIKKLTEAVEVITRGVIGG